MNGLRCLLLLIALHACVGPSSEPPRTDAPDSEALLATAPAEVQQWIAQLRTGDPDLQQPAMEALSEPDDPQVLTLLLAIARDPKQDGLFRMDVIHTIGATGKREAVRPLLDLLAEDLEARSGIWAALIPALGALGDPAAIPMLTKTLNLPDDDWLGREASVRALGQIGTSDAVAPLMAAVNRMDTRADAIEALAAIAAVCAAPTLIDVLDESEESLNVAHARSGLIKMGVQALTAIEEAIHQPTTPEFPNTWKRRALVDIAAEIGGREAAELLSSLRDDRDPEIAAAAQSALATMEAGDSESSLQ